MAANTILLDFSITPSRIAEPNERKSLQSTAEKVLSTFVPELKQIFSTDFPGGGCLALYSGIRSSFVTFRAFPQGLVTINIEYYKADSEEPLLNFESVRRLEGALTQEMGSMKSHKYPAKQRGCKADRYFLTADERVLEYDIDALVFEERSPYQKVQIVHSKFLGNLLVLDELQRPLVFQNMFQIRKKYLELLVVRIQFGFVFWTLVSHLLVILAHLLAFILWQVDMSERDLIYTETLMQRGKEDYTDKEIVILGGGDGALLYELLKEKPKFVTMFELDEVVLRACRQHLRGCCFDCLDKMEGENYKIIVDDCVKSLDKMIEEGKKVDYVFGDLTDIPVSPTPQGEIWNFIRLILNKSFQVLKPSGKFMTHGNGASSPAALKMFEEQLQNLSVPVKFSTDRAFVPSFLEDWVFYQVWPVNSN